MSGTVYNKNIKNNAQLHTSVNGNKFDDKPMSKIIQRHFAAEMMSSSVTNHVLSLN